MKEYKTFDLLNGPVTGTHLIEASAGTGKTFTITGLYLRLLLEWHLNVDEILVVTFTEAATGELQDRIRRKLKEAELAFSTLHTEDPCLQAIVNRIKDKQRALRDLREGLRTFDRAAIYTIHGFCGRMLNDNTFESGSAFDTELIPFQDDLKMEIAEDFWRHHFYNASPLFTNYVISKKFSPYSLLSFFGVLLSRRDLKIIPERSIPDTSSQEETFKEAYEKVRKAWPGAKEAVYTILYESDDLNRNLYRKNNIGSWMVYMEKYLDSGSTNPVIFDKFNKFSDSEIRRGTKTGRTPPDLGFFHLCQTLHEAHEDLIEIFKQQLLGLKIDFFHFMQSELNKRKQNTNIQFFDDLLYRLFEALNSQDGEKLADTIGKKFKAALIDEFQDTDPIQYGIFQKLFDRDDIPLFHIGDPKQAIYSFRGADIFAYMNASGHTPSHFTLKENWRSEPELIHAVNTIFKSADDPFIFESIPFQKADPAQKPDSDRLLIDGRTEPPLHIWHLNAMKLNQSAFALTKTEARTLIPAAVAREIVRLLQLAKKGRARIGQQPLKESDIAVLVRTNREAGLIQSALTELNVHNVLYNTGDLFQTREATEIERVLAGIAEPENPILLRSALATEIMGVSGNDLDRFNEDESDWEVWFLRFLEYNELWSRHGFIHMFRRLMDKEKILSRFMSLPDGERRNTNLWHLAEELHQAALTNRSGMIALLKWLSNQINSKNRNTEEHQLRLESDEKAVKIVTVHKSKGLEYPVVFCPFLWDGIRSIRSDHAVSFHDEKERMRLVLDLGSETQNENRNLAIKEELAESIRLLYVAMTRARNRCIISWGRIKGAETSALAYLFHSSGSETSDEKILAFRERYKTMGDTEVYQELQTLADMSEGTIQITDLISEKGESLKTHEEKVQPINCRTFSGTIHKEWRISSFSALTSRKTHAAELADRDRVEIPESVTHTAVDPSRTKEDLDIFSFPRGTRAGTFMHKILEHLDFTRDDPTQMHDLVMEKLETFGYDPIWKQPFCDMFDRVLSSKLDPDCPGLTLSCIPADKRFNELEFYYPLKKITPATLKNLFQSVAATSPLQDFPTHIERLNFNPAVGFMKGFIDLVFLFRGRYYLVDWKSNFLGAKKEDYNQQALMKTMIKEYYILQYHIYCIALNQYLSLRIPDYRYETHFGGVFYLFLRGISQDQGDEFGIFRDRPDEKFIRMLCQSFLDMSEMVIS